MKRVGPLQSRIAALAAALLALAVVATGCGGAAAGGGGSEGVTIRYQGGAGSVNVLELADALGYLGDVEIEKVGDVTGGPEQLRALVSDQADIATGPFFGATAQLVATGAPIKAVVATYGTNEKVSQSLVVLEDSPISTARDLIGKKVALNTLGANYEAVLDTWLAEEGLTPAEIAQVTLVPLPPLNTEQALREGQVDAAYLSSGPFNVAQRNGGIKVVMEDIDVIGPYNGGGAVLTERFLEQAPEAAETIATGIAKAVQYVESHTREETLAVYKPWLEEHGYADSYDATELNWPGSTGVSSPDASITDDDIAIWLDWLEANGEVDAQAITPSDVYTNDYNGAG